MSRQLTPSQLIERSIQKKYRKELWTPFILAVKRYALIQAGDRIAVCVSGGRDSMLLAKLTQLVQRYSDVPFEAVYLYVDSGCSPARRRSIEENARLLDVPVTVLEADVDDATGGAEKASCHLRPCRGQLYRRARDLGCNKIALGHHFNDVVESTVTAMLYGAQLQGMMPKVRSASFPGMELIRPLYCVHEEDILAWQRYNGVEFLRCDGGDAGESKRQAVKGLLGDLKRANPDIEKSVFNAIHAVSLDTFPGWKLRGEGHSFLERYEG